MALPTDQDDESRAISLLKQGRLEGLEHLVQIHQTIALRTAVLITQDWATAEDIVQAAFIRVWDRIEQFDDGRPFRPWFLRIVVNDAVKSFRKSSREVPFVSLVEQDCSHLGPLIQPSQGDPGEIADEKAALWRAISRLSVKERTTLVLRYYLELSEAEVAKAMACPLGTVKWRLHQARLHVRHFLQGPPVSDLDRGLAASETKRGPIPSRDRGAKYEG